MQTQAPRAVVILIPHTLSVDPSLQKEYDSLENEMTAMREELLQDAEKPLPGDDPAVRSTKENMMRSYERYSFRNYLAHGSQQLYLYAMSGEPVYTQQGEIAVHMEFDSSDGDIGSLREKARKYNCRFVVNFSALRLYRNNGMIRGALHAQLYDALTESLTVDSLFEGDDRNTGDMFSCESGTLSCAMINCAAPFLMESSYHITTAFAQRDDGKE